MTPSFDGCRTVALLRSGPTYDLYEALQEPLGRPVLVKALSASILPSSPFAASLEREARILSALDHPNILRLLDFTRRGDRMWLVLEHVDGWDLKQVLTAGHESDAQTRRKTSDEARPSGAALGAASATAIALEVARALDHAHSRNVIHRDIKPENILCFSSGQVKLTGFSVNLDESPASLPEAVDTSGLRNAGYLSPEQILGEPADPRGDFFSLGVVLYEMVTGVEPFGKSGDPLTAGRVRHDAPPLITRLDPHIPGSLERVVARCLEKMPSDRFQNAAELVSALEQVLSDIGKTDAPALARAVLRDKGYLPADVRETRTVLPRYRERKPGLPLGFMFGALGLMLAGGGVIQVVAARSDATPGQRMRALELVPDEAASLRVVATPWAHVFVDGQKVATTPFATPIPLSPGIHYVRLDHPNAPSEERTLHLAPGEAILLDVAMKIDVPKPPPAPEPPPVDTTP